MSRANEEPPDAGAVAPQGEPLYARLKHYVRSRVEAGEWTVGQRVPSENELVDLLGVSRMTANRALRELAEEGLVVRVRGKGSFVAARKRSSQFQSVPNIADEIGERGGRHGVTLVLLQIETAGPELSEALALALGDPAFHSILVHLEDDLPIQLEDRFVRPAAAPDYIDQPFREITPNAYLSRVAPIVRAEQQIEAVLAAPWEARLLGIARTEPCLLVRRRTFAQGGVVSSVRLLYPGSRYRLDSAS
ncbi:histidine utilization repressor [Aureimonas sp. Leaf454]|uniref:histidine utilization repressor n=1 Tax=Aureimonas sp. Leaf454 TaxID=1736381 RepID=UPI0006F93A3C|nr:histidine utilization repressor [Aureimonas sp. Leaf454]KQT47613.1 histidine utilization repressor [Aureimonas sp. Leaf454]